MVQVMALLLNTGSSEMLRYHSIGKKNEVLDGLERELFNFDSLARLLWIIYIQGMILIPLG